ncbi:hypothetical protein BHE74_00028717 [Ensete ventricosum]|nr:hypothetical protein BHE74_00028717 [Ensete ventricosum]RZR75620.1 hypothetical protein BHM03_00000033 [Ensete ventricosum]
MTVDFDDDVRLAEKEQTILLEPSSKIRLDRTIMPPQDQTPVKNADLELMPMNLKEEDCYVVNHVENLMVVDFDDYVSLAEKEDAGMAERGDLTRGRCSRMDGAEAPQEVENAAAGEEEEAAVRQPVGSGCDSSRALLGGEGAIGRRSDPVMIEQRGGRAASAARVLQSMTQGCREWRRVTPKDVLRAEEEQQIWWKMAPTKVASVVSNNYTDGPTRRKGKSRRLADQGKGPRDDCIQRPFNGIPWSQGILLVAVGSSGNRVETAKRMVAQVVGPQRATIGRGEERASLIASCTTPVSCWRERSASMRRELPSEQRMSGRVTVDDPWVSAVSQRGCPRTNGDRSCSLTANKKERFWNQKRTLRLDKAIMEFNAKLSDLGLTKAGPTGDGTHVSTLVMGTQGYTAPEFIATYLRGGVVGDAVGALSARQMEKMHRNSLVNWSQPCLGDKRKLYRIMDARLEGQFPKRGANALALLASKCVGSYAKLRPLTKSEVCSTSLNQI